LVLSGYLSSRVKFVGVLNFRARGPIHVGHSKEANVLYALKLPNGDLVVPASTWKGVLRSLAERLAPSLPMGEIERLAFETVGRAQEPEEARRNVREKGLMDDFVKVLERKPQNRFDQRDVEEKLERLGYRKDEGGKWQIEDKEWALVQYLSLHCPVGRLFGNLTLASSLRFFDAVIRSGLQRRPGIGINRYTGTVQENVLYFVETGDAYAAVPLLLSGEVEPRGNAPARLLASVLEAVAEVGIGVGGRKSAGLGLLELESSEFHAFERGKDGDERGALLANPFDAEKMGLREFVGWLRGER
jgi:CRISPR/Cas system CSM-associated protein Csm3 (group 7 of RAMP superfamily)